MFPLTVTLKRNLKHIELKPTDQCMILIDQELKRLKVDNIQIYNTRLNFKNRLFNGQVYLTIENLTTFQLKTLPL